MDPEPSFTRREGDQLSRRVDDMDRHGTRGLETIARQTAANTETLAELKAGMTAGFARHARQHERELHGRARKRRARTGTLIAAWTAAIATLGLLLDIAVQLPRLHR